MADPLIDGELASGEFNRQQSRFRDWIGGGAPAGADATLPVATTCTSRSPARGATAPRSCVSSPG